MCVVYLDTCKSICKHWFFVFCGVQSELCVCLWKVTHLWCVNVLIMLIRSQIIHSSVNMFFIQCISFLLTNEWLERSSYLKHIKIKICNQRWLMLWSRFFRFYILIYTNKSIWRIWSCNFCWYWFHFSLCRHDFCYWFSPLIIKLLESLESKEYQIEYEVIPRYQELHFYM